MEVNTLLLLLVFEPTFYGVPQAEADGGGEEEGDAGGFEEVEGVDGGEQGAGQEEGTEPQGEVAGEGLQDGEPVVHGCGLDFFWRWVYLKNNLQRVTVLSDN